MERIRIDAGALLRPFPTDWKQRPITVARDVGTSIDNNTNAHVATEFRVLEANARKAPRILVAAGSPEEKLLLECGKTGRAFVVV